MSSSNRPVVVTYENMFKTFQVPLYEQWKIDVLLSKHFHINASDTKDLPYYEFYFKIKICEDIAKEEEERNNEQSKSQEEMMSKYSNPSAMAPKMPEVKMPNISMPSMS